MLCILISLALVASGCGKGGKFDPDLALEKRELGEVYDDYMLYLKDNGKPPTELSHLEEKDALYAIAIRVLREGKYQVVWSVSDKSANTILAYATDAADKGGVVLMANGAVKTMTATQFNAAKR